MNVELVMFGTDAPQRRSLSLPAGTTVDRMCALLDLDRDHLTVLVNGVHATGDYILAPGDRVAVFPPLAGGQAPPMSILTPTLSRSASR